MNEEKKGGPLGLGIIDAIRGGVGSAFTPQDAAQNYAMNAIKGRMNQSEPTIREMFEKEFKQARMEGKEIFEFMGKMYNTKTAEEVQGMSKGGEFPDLNNDGETTYADILKGRGVYAQGDEVTKNLASEQDERIKQLYSGATDADLSMLGQMQRNPIPGTPEDYEKKIYLLEKEIASQFKEYHGAVEGGFEEQAAARLQGIQEMMAQRLQLKNEYTNQFNSNKVKGMAEGGEAIDNELAGMQMSEEDAMAEVGSAQEEMQMIQQLVVVVQQLLAEGISEEDLVAFLKEQGLDEEDINSLMQMVMQQMQQGQEDPIASELQEMQ